jgi:3-deoxy-D-manno-octulosonate 8-phosphate phosphatase (KDO 8-P phosphatase)
MAQPMQEILDLARATELLMLDVDGVLTDGGLYYFGEGGVSLRFSVRDGLGLKLAQRAGVVIAWISGRDEPAVRHRASDLGVEELHLGVRDKGTVVEGLLDRLAVRADRAAFVGDDLIDLPAMERVGLPIAVADAADEVRSSALYVTKRPGGHGAVREVIDLLLGAREDRG